MKIFNCNFSKFQGILFGDCKIAEETQGILEDMHTESDLLFTVILLKEIVMIL